MVLLVIGSCGRAVYSRMTNQFCMYINSLCRYFDHEITNRPVMVNCAMETRPRRAFGKRPPSGKTPRKERVGPRGDGGAPPELRGPSLRFQDGQSRTAHPPGATRALHDGRPGFHGAGGRLLIRPRCIPSTCDSLMAGHSLLGFGAGGRLPIWHGVGGFMSNSSSS